MDIFSSAMKYEIPGLFRCRNDEIGIPRKDLDDKFNQYALLDFIEFIYENLHGISEEKRHSFFSHYDIRFSHFSGTVRSAFREQINDAFEKMGLLYHLSESGMVERVTDYDVSLTDMERVAKDAPEEKTRDLLLKAIELYKTPGPDARQDSVEKLWDAFERLKTDYDTNKQKSASMIVQDISGSSSKLRTLFSDEFKTMTEIGNSFGIRHHERNQTDIIDSRHYDYFFNRCLSLVTLAIQYLRKTNDIATEELYGDLPF